MRSLFPPLQRRKQFFAVRFHFFVRHARLRTEPAAHSDAVFRDHRFHRCFRLHRLPEARVFRAEFTGSVCVTDPYFTCLLDSDRKQVINHEQLYTIHSSLPLNILRISTLSEQVIMRLPDLREDRAGIHKVPVFLHIKQLIAELTLTEDRPVAGAVKRQNINIILSAFCRIITPPLAHFERDEGQLSCFGHANHILLTYLLKHGTHQIGQVCCDLPGRFLLAKHLVIAAVCKDIAVPEGAEVICDPVNSALRGLVLQTGGRFFQTGGRFFCLDS
ncbi:MAG: hypothetical protein Q4G19_08980, partial [Clostridia bacterium]|nr:hypothetical protein [Clostridia bacterium]